MATAQRGVKDLFKKAWHEIPHIVGSSFMALLGIGLGVVAIANYYAKDGDNRRFKFEYTVIRDDDPQAECIRRKKESYRDK